MPGEVHLWKRTIIGVDLLTIATGALLALLANVLVQALVSFLAQRRETELQRAKLAAEAFGDFFEVLSLNQSLNGAHRNFKNGHVAEDIDPKDFADAINQLNATRGRLAAIASPDVVSRLAELERTGGGLTSETTSGRKQLTAVLTSLRKDLGVQDGAERNDLAIVLFGQRA